MKAIVFDEEYLRIGFTPPSLLERWTGRVKLFMYLIKKYNLNKVYTIVRPHPCPEDLLLLAHDKEYVEYVKEMGKLGSGYLDYGDTPAYPNVYHKARLAVGGTIALAKMIIEHRLEIGFNPQGGFHHAKSSSAAGFCVFNDIAIAVRYLLKHGFKRIAVVDIDGHHGDGTQAILYSEPVLKISLHRYTPELFFPGTGDVYELGENEGYGYSVNIPLPEGSGDDIFEVVLKEAVIPLLYRFKPEVIIAQMGVDGHEGDPLVNLRFTSKSYLMFAEELRVIREKYNVKILGLGGGGYDEEATSRMWVLMLAELAGLAPLGELRDKREGTSSNKESIKLVKEKIRYLKLILNL